MKKITVLAVVLLLIAIPLTIIISQKPQEVRQQAAGNTLLPGEQLWNGVSSYIFGTNLTGEWASPNIEFSNSQSAPGTTNTVTQNLVKQAGFTLLRVFVPHQDFATGKEMTDAEIQAKLQTVQNTGEQCLGVIVSINATNQPAGYTYSDLDFAKHLVSLWGSKCNLYEIGNEPSLSPQQYAAAWNIFVPALKAINPNAKFIGPVMPQYYGSNLTQFLQAVKSTNGPIPDAISWHYYPCGGGLDGSKNWSTCLQQTSLPVSQAADARSRIQAVLGYTLPVGISEWSADPDTGNQMALAEPQMSQFTTAVLQSMAQAKLDFANEFDIQSYAAYGDLDMLDAHNTPRPYFKAFAQVISQYKSGVTAQLTPTPTTLLSPTQVSSPTSPITPGGTALSLTLFLHGIGAGGDNVNASSMGNNNPLHPQRTVKVTILNASNQPVASGYGLVSYNSSQGNFQGTVPVSALSGSYLVDVKIDNFLPKQIPGIVNSTSNQTTSLPAVRLVSGDVNNDNQLDILDYNILVGCFGSKATTPGCTNKTASDINDDGVVDGTDYNLFLRELSVQKGDSGNLTPQPTQSTTPLPTPTLSLATPTSTITIGTHHYEYVFPDGGMYVYDMDNNFSLVKHVSLPTGSGTRGVVGYAPHNMLYISYGSDGNSGGSLLAYDLLSDKVVWQKTYAFGIDSQSITPDGKFIYMPDGETSSAPYWYVINASDGTPTGVKINGGPGPHNTLVSLNGSHVYMGARNFSDTSTSLTVADTATNSTIRTIGPFKEGVRPFTINGKETLAYVTTTGFLGFQVASITSGNVLYTVDLTQLGFPNSPTGPSAPSHGIALSPDETKLAVIDWPNDMVHVFDVTGLPGNAPKKTMDIKFTRSMHHNEISCGYDCAADGWLEWSRDGKFIFVGDVGDVIDTSTWKAISNLDTLYNTRKMLEVDFQNSSVSFVPTNRASVGFVTQ